MWRPLILLLLLAASLEAVGLRVVTFNIETHRNASGWPDYALENPGSVNFTSVAAILARIDADVVALQEVHTSDWNDGDVAALGSQLGLPYRFIGSNSGNFDTSLRVVFLSRYPFLSSGSILSPPGAREIARHCPAVVVDVPGTARDPLLITAHLKAGTGSDDRFRRAVEMERLVGHLEDEGVEAGDNFIILGDFNPSGSNRTFTEEPAGLPSTFSLGADITYPVTYSTAMLSYFSAPVPTLLDPRQLDGNDGTLFSGNTLDLIMISPALAGRPHATEVYRSSMDTSNSSGLPKSGSPLDDNSSALASDHFAVFGDFELDQDFSDLGLAVSSATVVEGNPGGVVRLTVTIPDPADDPVEVSLVSDDPAIAFPEDAVLTIPSGMSSASTPIGSVRNYLEEGVLSVDFAASASGYDPASVGIDVLDADGPYVFSTVGESLVENFDGFGGSHDPAPWTTDSPGWIGTDDGGSGAGGGRSYGTGGEGSLGYLADSQDLMANADFINQSGQTLTILDVGYVAEQWRGALGGSADRIGVDLIVDGLLTPLSPLAFEARTDLPDGPTAYSEFKSVRVGGLSILPGEAFTLRFTFEAGSGSGALPADVFVNEFHYDNASDDEGEFMEIVVGPGYNGELSDVVLVFYNGANGLEGDSHSLDTFALGTTTGSGHRVFSKMIPGIQNGSPDGLALSVGGVVGEFLSYEGAFIAVDGPATGMMSSDIGVSQNAEPLGVNAIGLTGAGGVPGDFLWQEIAGFHSPGSVNDGQSLELPGLPPQGLAIDDLMVTFVPDNDGDGLADDEDPDDDNDGQPDSDELAFGTDPFDKDSKFTVDLIAGANELSFPGAEGVLYTIEWCDDLVGWETLTTRVGAGGTITVPIPSGETRAFFRVMVE